MKTANYQVHIQMKDVPADDKEAVELELFDVLKAINQLPYDFEVILSRDGDWL